MLLESSRKLVERTVSGIYKKYLKQVENWCKVSREYLNGVGKDDETNQNEAWRPEMWSLCHDKGHRWGIMTSNNGSESLHNIFKTARGRPVCALIIATYYKLLEWFNERKLLARELANQSQVFTNRVSNILERRAEKAVRHKVQVVDIDAGLYEVIGKNERVTREGTQNRIYAVTVNQGLGVKCKCRKPQNTYIACSHVLAVCAYRNYDSNEFTSPSYTVATLMNTWAGHFRIFGGQEDWPPYEGDRIIPDHTLVKRGRRKCKRYNMTMDIMQGRLGSRHFETCGSINHTTSQHPQSGATTGSSQATSSNSRTRGILSRLRRRS